MTDDAIFDLREVEEQSEDLVRCRVCRDTKQIYENDGPEDVVLVLCPNCSEEYAEQKEEKHS